MPPGLHSFASGFHPHQAHGFVSKELVKGADGVASATDASYNKVRQATFSLQDLATGLPANATDLFGTIGSTITNLAVATFQIGASDVHAFVGLDGPFWIDANGNGEVDRDANGKVVHNLQDRSRRNYAPITSAQEHGEYLYLGSLTRGAIARLALP